MNSATGMLWQNSSYNLPITQYFGGAGGSRDYTATYIPAPALYTPASSFSYTFDVTGTNGLNNTVPGLVFALGIGSGGFGDPGDASSLVDFSVDNLGRGNWGVTGLNGGVIVQSMVQGPASYLSLGSHTMTWNLTGPVMGVPDVYVSTEGVDYGLPSPLTITSSDYTGYSYGSNVIDNTIYGYSISVPTDIYHAYYELTGGTTIQSTIDTFMRSGNYDVTKAYAFNAVFGSYTPVGGGTTNDYPCVVRLGFYNGGSNAIIHMIVIDTSDTRWQSGSLAGPALLGTFALPFTLTPYLPAVEMGGTLQWV